MERMTKKEVTEFFRVMETLRDFCSEYHCEDELLDVETFVDSVKVLFTDSVASTPLHTFFHKAGFDVSVVTDTVQGELVTKMWVNL
jgi:hypothetical protein